jgi:radical SAM superfamily enzyme YgiQ (UPF0313 family)
MRRRGRAAGRDAPPREAREKWLSGRASAPHEAPDSLSVALCYPSSYALGMSNLGFQAVLGLLHGLPGVRCERAFSERRTQGAEVATGPTAGGRAFAGANGTTVESGERLAEFDLVAFSVSYENDLLNMVGMLAAGGIPPLAAERTDEDPIVVMGGVCAHLNAEPAAPFVDAVLVGEAAPLVGPVVEALTESPWNDRGEVVHRLSRVPGAYVPSLYEPEPDAEGRILRFRASGGVPLPVRAPDGPSDMAVTTVLSDGAFFSDMLLVETSRGCGRGCLYCAAGSVLRPRVWRPAADVLAAIEAAAPMTNRVGLVTAALLDHPEAAEILRGAVDAGVELNISSVRAEAVTPEIARLLRDAGVRTVTVAPEAGRQDLRRLIGKRTTDDALFRAAENLGAAGTPALKLYFMVGLPGEGEDDVAAIPVLSRAIRERFLGGRQGRRRRGRVSVSVSAFVPKPRTAFQWMPMAGRAYLRRSLSTLRKAFVGRPRIEFSAAGPREARREGLLSRGGRELAGAIRLTALEDVPWGAAVRRAGVDEAFVLDRMRELNEVFPWEVVSVGTPREKLAASFKHTVAIIEERESGGH